MAKESNAFQPHAEIQLKWSFTKLFHINVASNLQIRQIHFLKEFLNTMYKFYNLHTLMNNNGMLF
jgi:hypothetical protein